MLSTVALQAVGSAVGVRQKMRNNKNEHSLNPVADSAPAGRTGCVGPRSTSQCQDHAVVVTALPSPWVCSRSSHSICLSRFHGPAKSDSAQGEKRWKSFFSNNHPFIKVKKNVGPPLGSLFGAAQEGSYPFLGERGILPKSEDEVVLWQLLSHNSFYNRWKDVKQLVLYVSTSLRIKRSDLFRGFKKK